MASLNAAQKPLLESGLPFPYTRHNFAVILLDVAFFALGMALLDPNAVLPLLMKNLGASGILIGAFAA